MKPITIKAVNIHFIFMLWWNWNITTNNIYWDCLCVHVFVHNYI